MCRKKIMITNNDFLINNVSVMLKARDSILICFKKVISAWSIENNNIYKYKLTL